MPAGYTNGDFDWLVWTTDDGGEASQKRAKGVTESNLAGKNALLRGLASGSVLT
jgi:hypothetical protein